MGSQKKGDQGNCLIRLTQYPHSRQLQVFSKKKGRHSESSSDLSIFVPKFSDLPNTCAITIIFSKSSVALLGFSKFRGTKHKIPICFATPKKETPFGVATHSLRSPDISNFKFSFITTIYKFSKSFPISNRDSCETKGNANGMLFAQHEMFRCGIYYYCIVLCRLPFHQNVLLNKIRTSCNEFILGLIREVMYL